MESRELFEGVRSLHWNSNTNLLINLMYRSCALDPGLPFRTYWGSHCELSLLHVNLETLEVLEILLLKLSHRLSYLIDLLFELSRHSSKPNETLVSPHLRSILVCSRKVTIGLLSEITFLL